MVDIRYIGQSLSPVNICPHLFNSSLLVTPRLLILVRKMASIEKQQELRPQPMEDFPDKSNQVDIVAGGSMARLENDMPKGYYYSPMFIGTYFVLTIHSQSSSQISLTPVKACGFGLAGGVGAFALASPVLETINEDIGPSPNLTWVAITYVLLLAIGSKFSRILNIMV